MRERAVSVIGRTLIMIVVAALLCSACGTYPEPSVVEESPAASGYPRTMANCGRTETYSRPPERVVVMNGGSVGEVSTLLALGQGSRIIANTQSYGASEEPGRAEAIERLPTGGIELNEEQNIPREAMLNLRPDFVLSTYGGGFDARNGYATREDLHAIGANTYIPPSYCGAAGDVRDQTVEDSYTMIRDLGRIFDVEDRAARLIESSRRQIAEVAQQVRGKPEQRVLLLLSGMGGGSSTHTVGADGIWNDVISKAGGVNPFAQSTDDLFAHPSSEQLAAADIDAVVVLDYHDPAPQRQAQRLFSRFPQWDAAKNNRFAVLSDSVYLGPNNATGIRRLAELLHPAGE